MGIGGEVVIAVLDDDEVAVAAERVSGIDYSSGRGLYRSAALSGNVDSLVAVLCNREAPYDLAGGRPVPGYAASACDRRRRVIGSPHRL